MRFDCDAAAHRRRERKEARRLRRAAADAYLTKWHPWFAWYPVRVGYGDCRWLEWVERHGEYRPVYKSIGHLIYADQKFYWEYRAPQT